MPHGTVIVIGGAEDKVRDRVILSRFVALAGGRDARIAVIATASSFGMEAGDRYPGRARLRLTPTTDDVDRRSCVGRRQAPPQSNVQRSPSITGR